MFERYTIPARRCIFFTLFEAKVFGSHSIEIEHLLLGILHENQALVNRAARYARCLGIDSPTD